MAGKGGGAWKVAYADFVTAMMAFFLVMWIVGQNDQVKEAIAHHFSDPFAKESEEDGAANQRPPRHPAPARITDRPQHEKQPGGSYAALLTLKSGSRTSIGTIVYFADDSAELDDEGLRQLKEIAPFMVGKPQKIELRGHSSRRPLAPGSAFADHWQLSYQRCLVVMAELEKLGISRERLRLSQAAGYEPQTAPDDHLTGGGYERVEVSLLNETTGAKVAQTGGTMKASLKVTEARHTGEGPEGRSQEPGTGNQRIKNEDPRTKEPKTKGRDETS
jgi:chemotaxis protein MotB